MFSDTTVLLVTISLPSTHASSQTQASSNIIAVPDTQAVPDNRVGSLRKEMHIKKIMQKFEYEWTKYNTKAVLALGAILIDILVESTDLL